ncbi:MAG: hypothetical protein H7263_13955 [Candidatus Sericytochromatia bacterium]|nr:hypothetical protein [Candidatus Sericytochromatia bacterium]
MTQFIAPNPVSHELQLTYNQMSDQYLSISLKNYLEQQEYSKFWSITTYAVSRNIFEKNIPSILSYFFKNDFFKLNDDFLNGFINGFGYFIQNQKSYTPPQILEFLSGQENEIFANALRLKHNDYLDIFFPFCTKKNLENYSKLHIILIKQKSFEQLEVLYKYCDNIDYNNGEILHSYIVNGLYDFKFIKKIIDDYKLDINVLTYYNGFSVTMPQQLLFNSFVSIELCHDFIVYFGEKINCDIEGSNNKNILNFLYDSNKKINDIVFCYSDLLTYCQFKEKNIAQIVNQVLEAKLVIQFYDHVMYDKIFNHTSFNSKYFDRDKVLQQILLLDSDNSIKKIRSSSQDTVNPITFLLDKFYKSEQYYQVMINKVHPFIYWGNNQGENFNEDTYQYLFKKYKKELLKLSGNEFKNFDNNLKQKCKKMGLTNVCLDTVFDKFFHKKNKYATKVIEEFKNNSNSTIEDFNQLFIQRISDLEIGKYIQSIELNSQQYLKISNELGSHNVHYMKISIPKFVNNAMDTYLHFSTIDPANAKESILVQLKLLNKKTFDILNEELENQKEYALRNIRIQNKIIEN